MISEGRHPNGHRGAVLVARAALDAPGGRYTEDCGCIGDGNQTLFLCDKHADITPRQPAAPAEGPVECGCEGALVGTWYDLAARALMLATPEADLQCEW